MSNAGSANLLISGQATILYGAATFSEDVDIWVEPDKDNIQRFVQALRYSRACYYKLTPALDVVPFLRGHWFHFVVPDAVSGLELYLDVMGQPPRVGSFLEARTRARDFETDFGKLPTVGIKELVEIKKTQRPADYPIIGRLALAHLSDANTPQDDAELRWALDHVFGFTSLRAVVAERPQAFAALAGSIPARNRNQTALLGRTMRDAKWYLNWCCGSGSTPLRPGSGAQVRSSSSDRADRTA